MPEHLISLTHPELQLLELVEEYGADVNGIAIGESWGSNNKTHHRYSPAQWATALHNLSQRGFVKFFVDRSASSRYRVTTRPSRQALLAEMRHPVLEMNSSPAREAKRPILLYHLTARGARAWQQFTRPDWNRYLEWSCARSEVEGEPDTGEVQAADRQYAKLFLEKAHHLGLSIIPASVRWTTLRNWQVRPWKILPRAHIARFRVNPPFEFPDWNEVPDIMNWLLHGWRHARW